MAFISLGNIDKNLIPILVGCVICFLNRILNQYEGTLLFKNVILTNIFISFSGLFAGIPYKIKKKSSKGVITTDLKNINKNVIKYLYINKNKAIIEGKKRLILLSSLIYFVQSLLYTYTLIIKTNSWIWYILITSIFYYLIFKIKLYKHHYLSVILILLIGFIIDLVLENIQNDIINNLFLLLIRFLREILLSLHFVIIKYIIEKKFVSVYEMVFFNGIINLLLLGIFSIFDYCFFGIYNYSEYFNNFNFKEFLVIMGEMVTQLCLNLSLLFTINYNSPCHVFIIFVFGQLAYYVNFAGYSIFVIVCLVIILFLSLIFNEIIEINVWGLSYNTKKNISARAGDEDELFITKIDTIDSNLEKDGLLIEFGENQVIE